MTASPPTNPFVIKLTESDDPVVMEFRWIPPGWFRMGQRGEYSDEEPPTWVRITQGFYMGVLPMTIQQHNALVSKKERKEGDEKLPVTGITWRQSQDLCRILNERFNKQLQIEGVRYECTLPTEAQWEYACRSGTDTEVCFGDGVGSYRERIQQGEYLSQDELIWYTANSKRSKPRDPRQGIPNSFGLQECQGNVWEWCQDRWDETAYRRFHSGIDEVQALELSELLGDHDDDSDYGENRVLRGGSLFDSAGFCRAACRDWRGAGGSYWNVGLRVCLVPLPDSGKQATRASTDESDQARRQAAADPDEHGDASPISNAPAMPAREFLELSGPPIPPPVPIRCIESKDGETWSSNLGALDFYQTERDNPTAFANVTKLVIGNAPTTEDGDDDDRIHLESFPNDLECLFPNLTHLYLWQIESLTQLPRLPAKIQVLDVRGCRNLAHWGDQPHINSWALHLEELFLDHTQLADLEISDIPTFPNLFELSFRGCEKISGLFIKDIIEACPALRFLDLSDCLQLVESLPELPSDLRVLKLNGCSKLERLPRTLPPSLRRLELKGASNLGRLPLIPARMDLLDLRETTSLRTMPTFEWHSLTEPLPNSDPVPIETWDPNQRTWPNSQWIVQHSTPRPRTLFLHGSGIECPPFIKGETSDTNVAERFHAFVQEESSPDYELKVILLGNGRSGKSSLASAWVDQRFDPNESSTHGIRLWEIDAFAFDDKRSAKLNIWDFAGQDLYHGTHRLFLQNKAIFIVLHSDPEHPGSNSQSDESEKIAAAKDEKITGIHEVARSPLYWLNMIESLSDSKGHQPKPPVIFVHSKSDRKDLSPPPELPDGHRWLPFSAKAYVDSLEPNDDQSDWPKERQEAAAKGRQEYDALVVQFRKALCDYFRNEKAHLLGVSGHKIKELLRDQMNRNQTAYKEHEESLRKHSGHKEMMASSPCPYVSLDDFTRMVKEHCSHRYRDNPKLLLEWLHSTGFLYYDQRYLPDSVVIDQRWAIRGIYSLMDPFSEGNLLSQIMDQKGVISKRLIQECWTRKTYAPEHQELFLSYMLGCGMIFVLLNESESVSNDTIFSFPSFYPKVPDVGDMTGIAKQQLIRKVIIPAVNESEIRTLLSELGAIWSRSMHAYRWGCTKRFKGSEESWFWMEWSPTGITKYGFPLELRFNGEENPTELEFVRETYQKVLRRTRNWGEQEFNQVWPPSNRTRTQEDFQKYSSSRSENIGRYLGLSYAGPNSVEHPQRRIVEDENFWLGEIPKRLGDRVKNTLHEFGLQGIHFYGDEDRERVTTELINNIAKSDIVIAFICKKYLHSEFCMVELQKIYQREPEGRFPNDQVMFVDVLQCFGMDLTPTNYRRKDFKLRTWKDYWTGRAEKWKSEALEGAIGANSQVEVVNLYEQEIFDRHRIYLDWYRAITAPDRETLLNSLFNSLQNNSISYPVTIPNTPWTFTDPANNRSIDLEVERILERLKAHIQTYHGSKSPAPSR